MAGADYLLVLIMAPKSLQLQKYGRNFQYLQRKNSQSDVSQSNEPTEHSPSSRKVPLSSYYMKCALLLHEEVCGINTLAIALIYDRSQPSDQKITYNNNKTADNGGRRRKKNIFFDYLLFNRGRR